MNNKEVYVKPDMEIVKLVKEEVVTVSGPGLDKGETPIDPSNMNELLY